MKNLLVPCLRYADAIAAINVLCRGFGFERQHVFFDEDDPSIVVHAQLVVGDSMLMLGSERPSPNADLYGWKSTAEVGGVTAMLFLRSDDPDAHCATARAAGIEIIAGPYYNQGYPGRSYDARDPGGHVWNVSSYDPWE